MRQDVSSKTHRQRAGQSSAYCPQNVIKRHAGRECISPLLPARPPGKPPSGFPGDLQNATVSRKFWPKTKFAYRPLQAVWETGRSGRLSGIAKMPRFHENASLSKISKVKKIPRRLPGRGFFRMLRSASKKADFCELHLDGFCDFHESRDLVEVHVAIDVSGLGVDQLDLLHVFRHRN